MIKKQRITKKRRMTKRRTIARRRTVARRRRRTTNRQRKYGGNTNVTNNAYKINAEDLAHVKKAINFFVDSAEKRHQLEKAYQQHQHNVAFVNEDVKTVIRLVNQYNAHIKAILQKYTDADKRAEIVKKQAVTAKKRRFLKKTIGFHGPLM